MSQIKTVKRRFFKVGQCLCLKAILLLTSTATAAIPPLKFYAGPENHIEIDLDHWSRLDQMFKPKYVNPEDFIPLRELKNRMDSSDLAASIIKQSFSTWMDSVERDSVWQTLNSAAQGLKANVRIRTAKNVHRVKMKFNPVSTQAAVKYEGVATTEFSYDLDDNTTKFEVAKNVKGITYLATHKNDDGNRSDMLGVRWSF